MCLEKNVTVVTNMAKYLLKDGMLRCTVFQPVLICKWAVKDCSYSTNDRIEAVV